MPTTYAATRIVKYGEVYRRIYQTRDAAETSLALWKREGLEDRHPSTINSGQFLIEERDC